MGNENQDLQDHQLLAAEAAGLLRLSQKISDLADKLAANCEKSETNEGRLWAKLQAAEKAKEEERAAKIEAYRKNADLLERAEAAEAENDALRKKLSHALASKAAASVISNKRYKENADLLERAEAAEKAGEYVNAQLSDALESLKKAEREAKDNAALEKENDALRERVEEAEAENHTLHKVALSRRKFADALEKENADLRASLEEKIKIILDFPGDYDPEITRELEEKNADLRQKLDALAAENSELREEAAAVAAEIELTEPEIISGLKIENEDFRSKLAAAAINHNKAMDAVRAILRDALADLG